MSLSIVDAPGNGHSDERQRVREQLYWRAWRQGPTAKRPFLIMLLAWSIGDIPPEMKPDPDLFGLTDEEGGALTGLLFDWIAEAIGKAPHHA